MDKFIYEICLALGLDRDGDTFKAINPVSGISADIFIQQDSNIIKLIKSND